MRSAIGAVREPCTCGNVFLPASLSPLCIAAERGAVRRADARRVSLASSCQLCPGPDSTSVNMTHTPPLTSLSLPPLNSAPRVHTEEDCEGKPCLVLLGFCWMCVHTPRWIHHSAPIKCLCNLSCTKYFAD